MPTCFDIPNMRVMNPVSFCEDGFRLVAGADRGNVSIGKSSVPMCKAVVMPSFSRRIGVVFGFSADAKMGRIDTRRVIANVHNHFIIGDRPNVELVRIPMSANRFFAGKKEDAVAIAVTGTLPFPAAVGLVKAALKYIVRAKRRVFVKAVGFACRHVALAAKFPRYGFFVSTLYARKLGRRLVSHKLPPESQSYDINEVLANVV